MSRDGYEPVLTLPSGGDTSYPGLVWHDGLLWMSYYSSHEGKSAIYLAKVKLPLEAEDIGSRLEPFVDEYLIDRLAGTARLEVQQPEPREVVFTADRPWEGNTSAYYTIFRDGDTYRMYYRGAHFDEATKKADPPRGDLLRREQGRHRTGPGRSSACSSSTARSGTTSSGTGPGAHNFTPFKDANPSCPPEARYKALAGVKGGLMALRSADGVHWEKLAESPVITRGAFDSQNLAFWDAHAGKYREYHRAFRGVRDIMTGTSDDFLKWTDPVFLEYPGAPSEHLYTNAVLPYPRAPHVLIGFPTRFLPGHPADRADLHGQPRRRRCSGGTPRP